MYERILVPLDGSETAECVLPNVVDLAVRMAPTTDVEITLVQVISLLTFNVITDDERAQIPYSKDDLNQLESKAQAYLDRIAAQLREKKVKVKTMVVTGHAAEGIIKAAEDTNADVIALATHGLSGIKRWALGSIADKVLHESQIPVLTVRAKHGNC
jgi:nucleotide-binding universal stress UspA family protein